MYIMARIMRAQRILDALLPTLLGLVVCSFIRMVPMSNQKSTFYLSSLMASAEAVKPYESPYENHLSSREIPVKARKGTLEVSIPSQHQSMLHSQAVNLPSKTTKNGSSYKFKEAPGRVHGYKSRPISPVFSSLEVHSSSSVSVTAKLCANCSSIGSSGAECKICLHDSTDEGIFLPITSTSKRSTKHFQSLAMLEENHRAASKGIKVFALRGEGPSGSIGYGFADGKQRRKTSKHHHEHQAILSNDKRADSHKSFTETDSSKLDMEDQFEETVTGEDGSQKQVVSVPITQLKDSQYVGLLGIGSPPQYIRPIFDTGSTNLWVVGADCKDESCKRVSRFNKKQSASFKESDPPVALDITFGTGQIHGTTGIDDMHLGPITVKQQSFGIINHEEGNGKYGNVFNKINFEGIVGLGFPEMSSAATSPFYDNIVKQKQIPNNEFSFYLSDGAPLSAIFVGGTNKRFHEGPIVMLPVLREHYWEVALDEMWIGDKKFCCDDAEKSYLIFDSGTSFNTVPSNEFNELQSLLPTEECKDEATANRQLPKIVYKTNGYSIELLPSQYLVEGQEGLCKPGFMQIDVPSQYGHAYILGSSIFMRNYYTVFRRGSGNTPSMVGISKAVHNTENQQYLQSVLEQRGSKELKAFLEGSTQD